MTERCGIFRGSRWLSMIGVLAAALLADGAPAGTAPAVLEVGRFSAETPGDGPPADWKPLTFKKIERHTRYRLVRPDGDVVVEAVSTAGASGLTREIRIDPKEFPIVEWRWRVSNLLTKGDPTRKDGDDYPARLYITFAYDPGRLGFLDKAKYETAKLLVRRLPAPRRHQLHLGGARPERHHPAERLYRSRPDGGGRVGTGATPAVGAGRAKHHRGLPQGVRRGAAHDLGGGHHDRHRQHRRVGHGALWRHPLPTVAGC